MDETLEKWRVLGERLHIARRRQKLTAEQLAQKAGTSRVTISRLENTHKPQVSFDVLWRIAEALGVSLDYLTGRKDEDTIAQPAAVVLAGN